MGFEDEYQIFMNTHLQARKGERLRRLREGHGQAEKLFLVKVWWPLFYHFQHLHPEYEIDDFKDGKRYLDFAYIRSGVRICFEIDGYGPHLKDISRWQFADQLDRQNQLLLDGWMVIRFSYDRVIERPRHCQQITQQMIGKMLGQELEQFPLTPTEKEVVRFAMKKGAPFTPTEICALLNRGDKFVRDILGVLVEKKLLKPFGGKQRIRSYKLNEEVKAPFFKP
jgi:very-short-patch-repair endonuclease